MLQKKNGKIAFRYLEGILYCIMLILSVTLCISSNMYIKMIPVAFISGLVGQIMLGKKAMTSVFSCIISLVLLQMRTPAMIIENIVTTVVITVISLCGEIFGASSKKLYHLFKLKDTERRDKEKLKNYLLCSFSFVIALVINSIVNGNIISLLRCKNNLKEYLNEEYSSDSRFEITTTRYSLENKAKYTFYTKDVLSNNETGKFIVYLDDNMTIQDEYKEKVLSQKIKGITEYIENIEYNKDVNISCSVDEKDTLTLNMYKRVDEINQEIIDNYTNDIVLFVNNLSNIENFNEIKQIKIVLESNTNLKDSLATYVDMLGYNELKDKSIEDKKDYIKKALNIEYIY